MLNFEAFELMAPTTWFGSMSGEVTELGNGSVFISSVPRGLWDDLCAGTSDTFFVKYLMAKAASCKDFVILVIDISVAFMHARTDEEICGKVPSGLKSSKFWRPTVAMDGTRKASKQLQECSSDKLVKSRFLRFSDNLDLEQHAVDFLACGSSSDLECLADELKKHFLLKKAQTASLRTNVESVWTTLGGMLRWISGASKACWMRWE